PITWAVRGQELRSVLQDMVNQECLDDKTRLVLLDCGGDSSSTTRAKAVKDAKEAVRDSVTLFEDDKVGETTLDLNVGEQWVKWKRTAG
ncbi:unnamed protein product, partial [Ectocarpus fasciculatus]